MRATCRSLRRPSLPAGCADRYRGAWIVRRSIVDHGQGSEILCTGAARLSTEGDALRYDEAVAFALAGKLIHATRAYRFVFSGGAIAATFSDGAPFFSLRLNARGIGTAIHHCGADIYALTLTVREASAWQTRWDVSGTKRLCIVTKYTRPSSGAAPGSERTS
jgi:hypothetical protein